jgi:hypothetical protein
MKIKIESDVFDIVDRIKEIDDGYFILYDLNKCVYELHNKNQADTYCMVLDGDLTANVLDLILYSKVDNIDNIIKEVDNSNAKIESNCMESVKNDAKYIFSEVYKFSNNSSKNIKYDSMFISKWR